MYFDTLQYPLNLPLFYFQSTFYVDWNPPCIGVLNRDGTKSDPRGDFAIKLETLVLADANTGYLARVQRGIDEKER